MYPTRTAPRPRETVSLPPNHPFATNFKPFDCHANSSTSSLQTPGCHAGIYPSSRSSPTTKPTGSVAKPLSPSRTSTPRRAVDDFGCFFNHMVHTQSLPNLLLRASHLHTPLFQSSSLSSTLVRGRHFCKMSSLFLARSSVSLLWTSTPHQTRRRRS